MVFLVFQEHRNKMDKIITSRGIRAGSLFKILFIGHAFSFGLVVVLMGIFSFFGYETVFLQGNPVFGITGLMSGIFSAGIFALLFSFFNWVFIFTGNWLYTRFRTYDIVINEADISGNN
jgi:hypothetical protein